MFDVNQCVLDILELLKQNPNSRNPNEIARLTKTLQQNKAAALPALRAMLSSEKIDNPKAVAVGNAIVVNSGDQKPRTAIAIAMAMTGKDANADVKQAIFNERSFLLCGNMLSDIVKVVEQEWLTDLLTELSTEPKSPVSSSAQMHLRENKYYRGQVGKRFRENIKSVQSVEERRELVNRLKQTPSPAAIDTLNSLLSEVELRDDVLTVFDNMRYAIASKSELINKVHPQLVAIFDECSDEDVVRVLEVTRNIVGSGGGVEDRDERLRRTLTPIYEKSWRVAQNPALSDDLKCRVLLLLGDLVWVYYAPFLHEKQTEVLDLLNTTYDTTQSKDTRNALAEKLEKIGYAPQLRASKCHICHKSMDESPLRKCQLCGKPACTSHLKEYEGFCSPTCLKKHQSTLTWKDYM